MEKMITEWFLLKKKNFSLGGWVGGWGRGGRESEGEGEGGEGEGAEGSVDRGGRHISLHSDYMYTYIYSDFPFVFFFFSLKEAWTEAGGTYRFTEIVYVCMYIYFRVFPFLVFCSLKKA